jgi:hypothetical protein
VRYDPPHYQRHSLKTATRVAEDDRRSKAVTCSRTRQAPDRAPNVPHERTPTKGSKPLPSGQHRSPAAITETASERAETPVAPGGAKWNRTTDLSIISARQWYREERLGTGWYPARSGGTATNMRERPGTRDRRAMDSQRRPQARAVGDGQPSTAPELTELGPTRDGYRPTECVAARRRVCRLAGRAIGNHTRRAISPSPDRPVVRPVSQ